MAAPRSLHVMTKPVGPKCNLDCQYCYYLEKEKLYPGKHSWRMSDEVLEAYVKSYIEANETPEVTFGWQGGEPTLLGVDFFRKAVDLQKKYADGKTITNSLQTNGTLLDDEWCSFFADTGFLIGLSVDGPKELHDAYRVDKRGRGTWDDVMKGLEFLQKHECDYNTLTVVNRKNSQKPLEVYEFMRSIGSRYLQFIPLVERNAEAEKDDGLIRLRLDHAGPPKEGEDSPLKYVTDWSVEPKQYGKFLCQIYDRWVRRDVGETYVQIFDVALGIWAGYGASLCVFMESCGNAMAMEHNGDVYACDHYVYPEYKRGNVLETPLRQMRDAPEQRMFGYAKRDTLPKYCRQCEVRFACNGECPKHRFLKTPDGDPGLNYLCAGYKRFFNHIDPTMKAMTALLQQRRPPADVMEMVKADDLRRGLKSAGRNDPCPFGSGKKVKACCGGKCLGA